MRKLMRSIARANMRKAGMERVAKKRRTEKGLKSYFAEHWREWAR